MEQYTIRKGNHSSDGFHLRLHLGLDRLRFSFKFDASCLYKIEGENNGDINKLYGVTWGLLNDKFSFRVGWNCAKENGKIQIYAYMHYKGNHVEQYLFDCRVDEWVWIDIFFDRLLNLIDIVSAYGSEELPYDFRGIAKYGYYNYFYFGGNEPAPHLMTAYIDDKTKSIWNYFSKLIASGTREKTNILSMLFSVCSLGGRYLCRMFTRR